MKSGVSKGTAMSSLFTGMDEFGLCPSNRACFASPADKMGQGAETTGVWHHTSCTHGRAVTPINHVSKPRAPFER